MARIFRIHPAIGIARVGNANRDSFFVGPETPGIPANFDLARGEFRAFKEGGLIRPQAAQFRVWEYEQLPDGVLRPKQEVIAGEGGVLAVEWSVHLANRKAAFFQFNGQQGDHDDFGTNPLRNANTPDADREPQLSIDPGAHSISGKNATPVVLVNSSATTRDGIPDLGELRTDEAGRLRVIGGKGASVQTPGAPELHDYVNNDGWFDDASDGPVRATITLQGAAGPERIVADDAWVVVGPPDFAPSIGNVVSLYETMWDVAVRELRPPPSLAAFAAGGALESLTQQRQDWAKTGKSFTDYEPSFTDEIAPLLERAFMATHVHLPSPGAPFHTWLDPSMWALLVTDDKTRGDVFARLRDPEGSNASAYQMPKGLGDEYVDEEKVPASDPSRSNVRRYFALTRYQYGLLTQWMRGKFKRDGNAPRRTTVETITPEGLDRAALENCVGGPFFPGIEVSWLVRKPEIYAEPFRLAVGARVGRLTVAPGFFTQQMALPWQADFRDCAREDLTDPVSGRTTSAMWWAAQRPDDVYLESDLSAQVRWARPPHFVADDDHDERFNEMRSNWFKQGFVSKLVGKIWVETERV